MKLLDGAVLLIIGAAVIGPIAANWVGEMQPPEGDRECYFAPFVGVYSFDGAGNLRSARMADYADDLNFPRCIETKKETTAETCERALEEIGAVPLSDWDEDAYGGWPRISYFPGIATGDVRWSGSPIRCIPAPSGLVK